MTERDQLIAAIIAQPDDDTVRLAYADWCDENGESERAEFVRVQVALDAIARKQIALLNDETDWRRCTGVSASWCPNCGDCLCPDREESMNSPSCPLHAPDSLHDCHESIARDVERLREREGELFRPEWLPDVGGQLREWYFQCYPSSHVPDRPFLFVVSRGFPDAVTCTLADWLDAGPAIAAAHPIRRVTLSDREPWEFGGEDPWFGWWREGGAQVFNRGTLSAGVYGALAYPAMYFGSKAYPTRELALDALSDACLAHARRPVKAAA